MMLGGDQSSTLCVVSKFLRGDQYGSFFIGNWLDRRPTKVQLSESRMGNQQFWFWISWWQIILSSMPLGTPISQADEPTAIRCHAPTAIRCHALFAADELGEESWSIEIVSLSCTRKPSSPQGRTKIAQTIPDTLFSQVRLTRSMGQWASNGAAVTALALVTAYACYGLRLLRHAIAQCG